MKGSVKLDTSTCSEIENVAVVMCNRSFRIQTQWQYGMWWECYSIDREIYRDICVCVCVYKDSVDEV